MKEQLEKQTEKVKELYGVFGNFEVVEKIGSYGNIVSRTVSKPCINEEGNIDKENYKVYNVLLKNGEFASEEWFDVYDYDREGNCIVGFKRTYEECERLKKIPDYIDEDEELLDIYNYIYGAINKEGQMVVKPIYDRLTYNNEDSYTAYHNGKLGYVSSTDGEQITPIIFTHAQPFFEGLAAVEYKGKMGYVSRNKKMKDPDEKSEYAIEPKYDFACDFCGGRAEISEDGLFDRIYRDDIKDKESPKRLIR